MTFVVTENCIRCKHTDCVEVCPADAFREGLNFIAISPDDCIDCGLCVPACPAKAIYQEEDVPEDQREFIALNRELAAVWEPIYKRKDAPADASQWSNVKGKLEQLAR
jgi:ferredoxin